MGQRITIEAIDFRSDARGLVLEPIGADDIPLQRNAHLVLTKPGSIRGNHYHVRGRRSPSSSARPCSDTATRGRSATSTSPRGSRTG